MPGLSLFNEPDGLQMVLNSALSLSLITVNPQGIITGFSCGSEHMLGYSAAEIVGKKTPLFFHDADEVAARRKEIEEIQGKSAHGFQVFIAGVADGKVVEQEWTYIKKDGSRLTVSLAVSELRDEASALHGYLGAAFDISKKKKAEEALLQEKYFFNQLINSLPGIFYLYDSNLCLRRWNRNHETLLGFSSEEINGKYLGDWHATEEGRDLAVIASEGIIEKGVTLDAVEGSLLHKNGTEIPFLLTGVRVESPEGPMLAGVGIDLTERRRLEEELRQSQKMESIGRLAGGIAHDFNNILTTIMGNVDMGRVISDPLSPVLGYLDNTMRAAESAGMLTRQLLAFSRKEMIAPRVLDLNQVLEGMKGMLIRLLGEDVYLRTIHASNLWPALIDPGQLDQIILNLAVNARDAMPDGGSLSLETANVVLDESYKMHHPDSSPGEYVMLSVSDTGSGMTPEVRTHLFEPFYTTKEMGRGTGLGLATVFGAVKQNKGLVDVYSEPGVGSTFKVFLPHATGTGEVVSRINLLQEVQRGTETILLAEDDPGIRSIAEESLTRLGYRVLACADGNSALDASIATGSIDLLVTDLIMPGMNGKELAKRMMPRHSNLKVLYTSGYTADIIGRHGMLEPGIDFLPKPYVPAELARRVRESLDNWTKAKVGLEE